MILAGKAMCCISKKTGSLSYIKLIVPVHKCRKTRVNIIIGCRVDGDTIYLEQPAIYIITLQICLPKLNSVGRQLNSSNANWEEFSILQLGFRMPGSISVQFF